MNLPPDNHNLESLPTALPAGAIVEPAAVERLAVFHLNAVGDMVFSLPALKSLRETFPQARITSILRPHLLELLQPAGIADEILMRPDARQALQSIRFISQLRKRRFQLALLFSQSATANIFAFLSGAPVRVGFIDTIFPFLLTHPLDRRGITCTEKLLHLVEKLSGKPQQGDYVGSLMIGENSRRTAEALLEEVGLADTTYAILSFAHGPGPVPDYKTWKRKGFVEVGKALISQGIVPIVIGGQADKPEAEAIAHAIGSPAVSLAGRTSLGQLAAIIQGARVLVGVDSGPVHLAAALEVPVVGLYGPTDPTVTGPHGNKSIVLRREMPCAPCRVPDCDGRPCITSITPEEVVSAAQKLMDNTTTMAGKA